MTELEKQLFDALKHIFSAIERQLELIAERAPGQFLDKRPVVQALGSHARRANAAIAAAEAAQALGAEPVAWMSEEMVDGELAREFNGHNEFSGGRTGVPLYAEPQPASAQPAPAQVDQQAPGKWQPISTAPKNGMHILCYMETDFGGHMEPMYWSDGCWNYCLDGDYCQFTPSHWMPAPPAPTQESGARLEAEAKGGDA
ncbi:hypothetical protein VI26_22855 [Chromobacterium sp. LK1]|uniref:hypothetical protein n=1 Tax=Chromobacterium sp. LK1 TaxID=1628193 RepID=UPI00065472AC|nr:hypothetical protein [Chromobacterium sp. LK1]KMN29652.1 hypothetical protein VI26_22855 [Chromobacterium sp. LK1]